MKRVVAWYFNSNNERLRFGDERKIVLRKSHSVKGTILTCAFGLHASKKIQDAANYSYPPAFVGNGEGYLYLVSLSGTMAANRDKIAARTRYYHNKISFSKLCVLIVQELVEYKRGRPRSISNASIKEIRQELIDIPESPGNLLRMISDEFSSDHHFDQFCLSLENCLLEHFDPYEIEFTRNDDGEIVHR